MTLYIQFLLGMLLYGAIAYTSYSEALKASKYYFLIGLGAALVANLIWLLIARAEPDSSKLMIKGLFWDSMLTIVYIVVPLLLFKANLSMTQSAGLGLIVMGLILTKV
jgi:drug/metabolite transporter (DMT)-like permease